jgi:GntR family transcriptional regulator
VVNSERAALRLQVDLASPVPPYEQVRAQIAGLVSTAELDAGTRLPSVRQLAADLGLANGTVARAYRELEATGVVDLRRRSGAFVRVGKPVGDDDHRRAVALAAAADHFAQVVEELGSDVEPVLVAVRTALLRRGVRRSPTDAGVVDRLQTGRVSTVGTTSSTQPVRPIPALRR